MPNPLTLTDAVDLTNVAVQDLWIKGSEKESRQFEQFYNVETGVVDYQVIDSSISGLGYAGRITENAAVTAASPAQGFDKTYTLLKDLGVVKFPLIDSNAEMPTRANPQRDAERLSEGTA